MSILGFYYANWPEQMRRTRRIINWTRGVIRALLVPEALNLAVAPQMIYTVAYLSNVEERSNFLMCQYRASCICSDDVLWDSLAYSGRYVMQQANGDKPDADFVRKSSIALANAGPVITAVIRRR